MLHSCLFVKTKPKHQSPSLLMQEQTIQSRKNKNCFYICGLTGGPFFPIPAIIKQVQNYLPNANPVLIGVKNSYESKIASELLYIIEYLPKAKLDILSFKNLNFLELIAGFFGSVVSILMLVFSVAKCLFLLIKYRPILVYSTGSFLAVPMLWATKLTNILKLTNSKIVVHQQDATMGLANRLTANLANIKSCVFPFTKSTYVQFQNAQLIPNPIIVDKYSSDRIWQNTELEAFVKNKTVDKPLLLIFGGGSGALAINQWVSANIDILIKSFKVVHLTGLLQNPTKTKGQKIVSNSLTELSEQQYTKSSTTFLSDSFNLGSEYYKQQSIFTDMPTLLSNASLVVCRAGLGSISELSLLNKPTFLVPLQNSHQEQNAYLIAKTNSNFKVLKQENQDNWLNIIKDTKFEIVETNFDRQALDQYYNKLIKLINS